MGMKNVKSHVRKGKLVRGYSAKKKDAKFNHKFIIKHLNSVYADLHTANDMDNEGRGSWHYQTEKTLKKVIDHLNKGVK